MQWFPLKCHMSLLLVTGKQVSWAPWGREYNLCLCPLVNTLAWLPSAQNSLGTLPASSSDPPTSQHKEDQGTGSASLESLSRSPYLVATLPPKEATPGFGLASHTPSLYEHILFYILPLMLCPFLVLGLVKPRIARTSPQESLEEKANSSWTIFHIITDN
jgi:hypothetical protein